MASICIRKVGVSHSYSWGNCSSGEQKSELITLETSIDCNEWQVGQYLFGGPFDRRNIPHKERNKGAIDSNTALKLNNMASLEPRVIKIVVRLIFWEEPIVLQQIKCLQLSKTCEMEW